MKQLGEFSLNSVIKTSFQSLNLQSTTKSFLSRPANWGKCVLAAGTAYFIYKTLLIYIRRRRYRHIPGPVAPGISGFYFGHLFPFKELMKKDVLFVDLLNEWTKEYGEVFKFQFGDEIIVFTTNKEAIKEALIIKNYPKVKEFNEMLMFPFRERFLGYGLLTEPEYHKWKNRRALFNPGFQRSVLMTFVKQFNSITDTVLDNLRQKADGKTLISLFNECNRATLDAIAMIAFGLQTNSVMDPSSKINSYLAHILKLNNEIFVNPFLEYLPNRFKEVRQFKQELRYLRKMGRDRILESIELFKNSDTPSNDILSSILKSAKETNLDLETMIDDFMTFFLAGQETTANALAFSYLELGRRPDIVQKAREEVDRVLGKRTEITYQDVNDLKYCSAIFKETLRFYPPVPNVNRQTNDKLNINGYEIPIGTFFTIGTYINARQEKYFKDAYEFKPERFLNQDNSESKIESYTYLPFSLGPRNCIGMNFAQLEGVIMIAKLIQNFDIQLDPTQSFAIEQNLTLRPKDGTRCFLTIRK